MFLVTFGYFVFLAASLLLYYLVPGRVQWIILLLSSMIFYMLAGTPFTIVYLLITIVTVWAGSNQIEKYRDDTKKSKRILVCTLLINIGILSALKYTNFFLRNYNEIGSWFGLWQEKELVRWTASLGVSFYTLQALGYLLDVYWGTSQAQPNIGKIALFTSWFPQMSSGPISRYHQISDDLYGAHRFSYRNLCFGLQRILFGLVKKLVIAENLAFYVNPIFAENSGYTGWFIWIGMAMYLLQLYTDFSGCMDIVIGSAECFGVRMPENFDRPFHSQTIQEFWKRWHITLGTWAQDYIMYPILRSKCWANMRRSLKAKYGKKVAKDVPAYIAMLILWAFMGIWHGGDWRYIIEMVWFWFIIMTGQLLEKKTKKLVANLRINTASRGWTWFRSIRTTFIFGFGVVFFRSSSVAHGFHNLRNAFSVSKLMPANFAGELSAYRELFTRTEVLKSAVCIGFGLIILVVLTIFEAKGKSFREWLEKQNLFIRWMILYIVLFGVILFGVYGPGFNASEFIYGGF